MKKFVLFLMVSMAIVEGCKKKVEVAKIAEWEQFQDPYFKITFTYPKGWYVLKEPNRVTITTSQEAAIKFFDPTSKNPDGAQLIIVAQKSDSLQDIDKFVNSYKNDLTTSGFEIRGAEPRALEGVGGTQITYVGRYDENTKISAIRAITFKDSTIYYVHYGAFNELFEPYKLVYDSVVASIVLPKPKVTAKNVDPSLPVTDFEKFQNEVLEVSYPANFGPSIGAPKGEVQFAVELKGYRVDCTINIDVRPAKKLTLEKIVQQNSKNFKNVGSKGSATVSGEKATYLNYTPAKDHEARVYFVVKNDKFYRIILIYYTPMKKEFLPAFEKTVASLRFK